MSDYIVNILQSDMQIKPLMVNLIFNRSYRPIGHWYYHKS